MTVLYYDPIFLQHDTGFHPENPGRIVLAARALHMFAVHMGCLRADWKPVSAELLGYVHQAEYVEHLRSVCESGGGELDADTIVSPESFHVASMAAGAVTDAVSRVLSTDEHQAFCLIRPPGHHAFADRSTGFCLFNNVAVGRRTAIRRFGLNKVLIVDWDVHHGNGTQAIFWEDAQVGYLSIHRHPFYPGTGLAEETGAGPGMGTNLNVPVPFGTPRRDYLDLFTHALEQIAEKVKPELILISAGFDAHRLDPIGSLGLESEDFGLMTRKVVDVARAYSGGRMVSLLEGGYHPTALAECVEIHVHELLRSG